MSDSYRDLIAWQKAKTLALDVYVRTRKFPKDEIYGLTSQMRRAAVSIPSNIVEGEGRYSRKEFVQFLFHARGSLLELITQLSIAHELDYLDLQAFRHLDQATEELGRILNGLIKRFQTSRTLFPKPKTFDLRPHLISNIRSSATRAHCFTLSLTLT
jgi:four helix bundle protein